MEVGQVVRVTGAPSPPHGPGEAYLIPVRIQRGAHQALLDSGCMQTMIHQRLVRSEALVEASSILGREKEPEERDPGRKTAGSRGNAIALPNVKHYPGRCNLLLRETNRVSPEVKGMEEGCHKTADMSIPERCKNNVSLTDVSNSLYVLWISADPICTDNMPLTDNGGSDTSSEPASGYELCDAGRLCPVAEESDPK
ncbi:hypothetical protein N1851_033174 [Merluccius polli]|uniref:Uncharacterized protein n=1 Tax=Merluccius polli TaxID=89951 RepID=A0AA47M1T7_MERPO|nr:hypothetical protein N1851_033174 [Merluccius polli]